MKPRILILTSGQLCRNPRVLKEADLLGRSGYDVTVLTVANIPRFEAMDELILRTAPFRKVVLDQLGRSPGVRARTFRDKALTWLARRANRTVPSAWAFGPYGSLLRLGRAHPADLTIAHTELPLCVAHTLLRDGRRVAADFEDWHSEDLLPTAQTWRPLGLLRRVERDLLRMAAFATTTSAAMAAALGRAYDAPVPQVVRNTFPLQTAIAGRDLPPAFIWFSQTIGPGRGVEEFVDGWSRMREDSRLTLLGDIDATYRSGLLARAGARREALTFQPVVPPDDLGGVLAQHRIGLALEPTTPANKNLTISNKIFQYLNAGLAVLATDTAGQREVLARADGAAALAALADPPALARQLDALVADAPRLDRMQRAARAAAEREFNWDVDGRVLLDAVSAALAPRA